ncbi:hypothetical protein NMY22_g11736 [Coprinellus aureogranulatus]|nr:hypothetical protein NMY22_g11736 [Coprinellus aureogranulatus]
MLDSDEGCHRSLQSTEAWDPTNAPESCTAHRRLLVVAHVVDRLVSSPPPSTMPSLRRTSSSPGVRSSPYSSALNSAQGARGHGHRRSSGSNTTTRRVLADIEWWRVTDGQCDSSAADQESEEHNHGEAEPVSLTIPGITFHEATIGAERQSSIMSLPRPAASPAIESTPEGPTPIDFDGLRLDLDGLGPIFFGDNFETISTPAPSLGRGCLFSDSPFVKEDSYTFDFPGASLLSAGDRSRPFGPSGRFAPSLLSISLQQAPSSPIMIKTSYITSPHTRLGRNTAHRALPRVDPSLDHIPRPHLSASISPGISVSLSAILAYCTTLRLHDPFSILKSCGIRSIIRAHLLNSNIVFVVLGIRLRPCRTVDKSPLFTPCIHQRTLMRRLLSSDRRYTSIHLRHHYSFPSRLAYCFNVQLPLLVFIHVVSNVLPHATLRICSSLSFCISSPLSSLCFFVVLILLGTLIFPHNVPSPDSNLRLLSTERSRTLINCNV